MAIHLAHNNYGKSRVRLMKVTRLADRHELKEVTVNIQFEGKFEKVYTEGDNSNVLPTDTMKNTVYALAKNHPLLAIEEFGETLGKYFLDHNPDIERTTIELVESLWNRIPVGQKPHAHSFTSAGNEKRTAIVTQTRTSRHVESGIQDLLVLKTTGSAFTGYIKDKFTTLKETDDRIFATNMNVRWQYSKLPVNYNSCYEIIRTALLETFAEQHSLSVQHTVYAMGEAALEKCKDLSEIKITTPNKHCLLVNLEPFGLENKNEIFVPTDEPFGLIEGVMKREK